MNDTPKVGQKIYLPNEETHSEGIYIITEFRISNPNPDEPNHCFFCVKGLEHIEFNWKHYKKIQKKYLQHLL